MNGTTKNYLDRPIGCEMTYITSELRGSLPTNVIRKASEPKVKEREIERRALHRAQRSSPFCRVTFLSLKRISLLDLKPGNVLSCYRLKSDFAHPPALRSTYNFSARLRTSRRRSYTFTYSLIFSFICLLLHLNASVPPQE